MKTEQEIRDYYQALTVLVGSGPCPNDCEPVTSHVFAIRDALGWALNETVVLREPEKGTYDEGVLLAKEAARDRLACGLG